MSPWRREGQAWGRQRGVGPLKGKGRIPSYSQKQMPFPWVETLWVSCSKNACLSEKLLEAVRPQSSPLPFPL